MCQSRPCVAGCDYNFLYLLGDYALGEDDWRLRPCALLGVALRSMCRADEGQWPGGGQYDLFV